MHDDHNLLPVLPQRDLVAFPRTIVSLTVTGDAALTALSHVREGNRQVFLVAQKSALADFPGPADLFQHGVLGEVLQVSQGPDKPTRVMVDVQREAIATHYDDTRGYLRATVAPVPTISESGPRIEALVRTLRKLFAAHMGFVEGGATGDAYQSIMELPDPQTMACHMANSAMIALEKKQGILEATECEQRLTLLASALQEENDLRELESNILSQVKNQIGKSQREYFLNEQIKVIERELGMPEEDQELDDFEQQILAKKLSAEAREKANRELSRMGHMAAMSPEATVLRTWLETLLELPWGHTTRDNRDLDRAQAVLDADHFALEKIKERIIEFLAVHSRVKAMRGPVLCLVGPPGVGKTSLARSVARALRRKFVRVALGGVRDEAEIRGHRRTYIGSMPGKIIQSMRKAGSMNPVFLLDEIDKMSSDFRGDPASALLEVLDPEQNTQFSDHYLEVDFDLSRVMFITTANSRSAIPAPLLDRMEILQLSGYTEDEKMGIASKFLLPRQLKGHGLKATDVVLDEATLRWLIRSYTREAGVRKLEQHVASLCRKAVRRNLQFHEALPITLTPERIRELLGPPRFRDPHNDRREEVGVAVGLAWTEVGGELLPAEVVVLPGKGGLMLTGKLGEVMQESAKAALSWIRAHAHDYGIGADFHKHTDIHVHFPEGAVPKDGPSAGITTVAALVSALSRRAVRQDVAMTGEINLRGQVMRIGGLKEKVLAAHREGITTVLIPSDNIDDLEDIPQNIRQAMVIQPVANIADALKVLLLPARPGASATPPGTKAPEAPAAPEKPRRRRAPAKPVKSPPAPAAKAPRAKARSPRP